MDLLYLLNVVWRKKWIIISLGLFSVTVAYFLMKLNGDKFESLSQYSTGFTAERVRLLDGTAAIDLYSADAKFNNVTETFKSPKVIGFLSYKLLLHDLTKENQPFRNLSPKFLESDVYKKINKDTVILILKKLFESNSILNPQKPKEKQILDLLDQYEYDYNNLTENLIVRRVERTDYLNIVFRSENPLLSSFVVNTIGSEFLRYYTNLTSQRSEESADNIRQLVDLQQKKVDSLSQKLLQQRLQQGSLDPLSLSTSAMESVKEFEKDLASEKSDYNTHLEKLNNLKRRKESLITAGASTSTSTNNNEDVIKLINKKNELVRENARKGGNDVELSRQITDLNNEITTRGNLSNKSTDLLNEELKSVIDQLSEEQAMVNATEITIRDYESSIRKYLGLTKVNNTGSDILIDIIRSQLDIENKALQSIKEKYNQAEGLLKDNPAVKFRQTLEGQPALEPEKSKRFLTLGFSGFTVMFISALYFVFLELINQKLRTPAIFQASVALPILGILNDLNFSKISIEDLIISDLPLSKSRKKLPTVLFKENIRKIRFELLRPENKIIMFTSTKPGSGKSTIIEALALSLLMAKKSVLIMDLNFKNNSLSKKFNSETNIQDYFPLHEEAVASNLNTTLIANKTKHENIDIIGCIISDISPIELLSSLELESILIKLKSQYDIILVEVAALNVKSDAKEMFSFADTVVSICSADDSIGPSDVRSNKDLADLGLIFSGVILNKVKLENMI